MEIPRALLEPENLSAMAGGLLSFLMSVIPGLNVRWDKLASETKRGIMAVLSAVTAIGLVFWTCRGTTVCLGGVSWWVVGEAIVFAIVANQGVDRITPKSWFLPKWRNPPAADLGERPYPPGMYPSAPKHPAPPGSL